MFEAVEVGDLTGLRKCLSHKAKVNEVDSQLRSPLLITALHGEEKNLDSSSFKPFPIL